MAVIIILRCVCMYVARYVLVSVDTMSTVTVKRGKEKNVSEEKVCVCVDLLVNKSCVCMCVCWCVC